MNSDKAGLGRRCGESGGGGRRVRGVGGGGEGGRVEMRFSTTVAQLGWLRMDGSERVPVPHLCGVEDSRLVSVAIAE